MKSLLINLFVATASFISFAILIGILLAAIGYYVIRLANFEKEKSDFLDEHNEEIQELSKKYKFFYVPYNKNHIRIIKGLEILDIYIDRKVYSDGCFYTGNYTTMEECILGFLFPNNEAQVL